MFKREAHRPYSESVEQTGRPEVKQNLKLPRLSNLFSKKNPKVELTETTIFELIPELEAACAAAGTIPLEIPYSD